jgi:hypothetical protein
MPAFWGAVPSERPVRREALVSLQRTLPPDTWRRPSAPLVRAGASGRVEQLLVLAWTAEMLATERAAGVRVLRRVGITAGQRVANNLPGALVTPGSLLLGDVVEELGALDVPLGETKADGAIDNAWALIERVQPHALVLEAATAERFFAAAPIKYAVQLRALVWLHREPPKQLPSPPPSWKVEQQLHCLAVPEVLSFFAYSCNDHFHCDESISALVVDERSLLPAPVGALLVEWVDAELGPLSFFVPWAVEASSPRCSEGRPAFRLVGSSGGP